MVQESEGTSIHKRYTRGVTQASNHMMGWNANSSDKYLFSRSFCIKTSSNAIPEKYPAKWTIIRAGAMLTFDDAQEKKATEKGEELDTAPGRGPEPSRRLHDNLGQLKTLLNPFLRRKFLSFKINQSYPTPRTFCKIEWEKRCLFLGRILKNQWNQSQNRGWRTESGNSKTAKIGRRKWGLLTAVGGWGLARAGGLGYGRLTDN